MFADTFRFERDYFYDSGMHGVDWEALRKKYAALLDDAVTRWDVNFVLGELIAELNASHTYRGGGDEEQPASRGVGLLGVDWEVANGAYRIKRIIRGGPWDLDARSPLAEPGVMVREGEYVLAVNGVPLDAARDPWAAFEGLAGQPVTLTVNGSPEAGRQPPGGRQVPGRRDRAAFQGVDRAAAPPRGRGDRRQKRATSTFRAPGIDAQNDLVRQFNGAVDQGRSRHRRALQQRRADPRSLHRAAQPPASELLGDA